MSEITVANIRRAKGDLRISGLAYMAFGIWEILKVAIEIGTGIIYPLGYAGLAGYTHDESMDICYSAQFVDLCTKTLLSKLGAPQNEATTQLQLELADSRTDILGLQDITRIWASFHFLPYDLYAQLSRKGRGYMNRYRLICKPNGPLLERTVNIANGTSLQHVGVAVHVLADTWAHSFFAGTPSSGSATLCASAPLSTFSNKQSIRKRRR